MNFGQNSAKDAHSDQAGSFHYQVGSIVHLMVWKR